MESENTYFGHILKNIQSVVAGIGALIILSSVSHNIGFFSLIGIDLFGSVPVSDYVVMSLKTTSIVLFGFIFLDVLYYLSNKSTYSKNNYIIELRTNTDAKKRLAGNLFFHFFRYAPSIFLFISSMFMSNVDKKIYMIISMVLFLNSLMFDLFNVLKIYPNTYRSYSILLGGVVCVLSAMLYGRMEIWRQLGSSEHVIVKRSDLSLKVKILALWSNKYLVYQDKEILYLINSEGTFSIIKHLPLNELLEDNYF